MGIKSLNFYLKHLPILGIFGILISVIAWYTDIAGIVYACPYCRLQRTVIGILGVIMVMKHYHNWFIAFISTVIAFLGAHVASAQNFMGWMKISKGTFKFNENLLIDPFLLSAAALFIIIGQICLIIVNTIKIYNE